MPHKKRRLALISLHFAEYAALLARSLATDWDVLLILRSENAINELGADWRIMVERAGIQVLALDRSLSVSEVVSSARSIVHEVRAFQPDILHLQECGRDALMLALPFLPAVPRILTVHDPKPHLGTDAKILGLSRSRVYKEIIRRWPTAVITHGCNLAEQLITVNPWLRNKVSVLPHGPLGAWRQVAAALPPDGSLLFFGRMEEYKGLGVFVDAVSRLKSKGLRVTGVVAGQGPDLSRYSALMKRAECFEVHDRYIASLELTEYFNRARAVILPYLEGTQSGVAAMALGFGRPVVASAVGSIPELVRDGVNGLLVPPADPEALAGCIEKLVCDPALAERLALGARALRDGPLSWTAIAQGTTRIYNSSLRSTVTAHGRCPAREL